jgi:predicted heme/steroid binding protein
MTESVHDRAASLSRGLHPLSALCQVIDVRQRQEYDHGTHQGAHNWGDGMPVNTELK